MRNFAENDLSTSSAVWKVVCFHFSPYTFAARANTGGVDDDERIRTDFGDFFERKGVDLVIAGHEHFYERTHPLNFNPANFQAPILKLPDGGAVPHVYTNPSRPMYIVTGGGGQQLSANPQAQPGDAFLAAQFSEHHLTTFAVSRTDTADTLVVRAIMHTGAQLDTATIVKTRVFERADANGDGDIDISDALKVLFFLFQGAGVGCQDATDADDNGIAQITDAVYILRFLFLQGPQPPAPFGACGLDPTADTLPLCAMQSSCP